MPKNVRQKRPQKRQKDQAESNTKIGVETWESFSCLHLQYDAPMGQKRLALLHDVRLVF
jgi:hypothetical protein